MEVRNAQRAKRIWRSLKNQLARFRLGDNLFA